MISKNRYFNITSKFDKKNILIIGDIMLDLYLMVNVDRISQEAPVPIVNILKNNMKIGGAANVAYNIKELGAVPMLIGIVGSDLNAKNIYNLLKQKNIETKNIIVDNTRNSTVKTRIISRGQQMIRFDSESVDIISLDIQKKIIKNIKDVLPKTDGIIIADYGKGLLTNNVVKKIFQLSKEKKIPINIDPKFGDCEFYSNANLLKPNLFEFKSIVGDWETNSAFIKLGNNLRKRLNLKYLLVTKGESGCTLFTKKNSMSIPTKAINVHDVSGAGDTVISVFTLAQLGEAKASEACFLANIAAGYVCEQVGVVPISLNNLNKSVNPYFN